MNPILIRGRRVFLLAVFFSFFLARGTFAAEIFLNNGDRISGEVISREEGRLSVMTESMGLVEIPLDHVKKILEDDKKVYPEKLGTTEKRKEPEIAWEKEISLGFNAARGNTETTELTGSALLSRRHIGENEITFKGNIFYSESDKEMDSRKWYALARYALNFSPSRKWYSFYRIEVDHDRFANINYRTLPAAGLGYWVLDMDDTELVVELGSGLEYTNYRHHRKSSYEAVLAPRLAFKKRLFRKVLLAGSFDIYPEMSSLGEYRFRAETTLTTELTEKLALRLSLIDEYKSQPEEEGVKKNDLRLISSIVYSF